MINERKIEMRGAVHIYVNKKDREIYLLKEYKTKIGYWTGMGYLIQTARESLKKEVLICIRDSIEMWTREEKTHSYSSPAPGFEFILTKEEFDEKFDEIMDFLISNVKMIK